MSQASGHSLGLWKVHDLDGRRTAARCRSGDPPLVVHGAVAIRSAARRATAKVNVRARGELVVRASLALKQDSSPLGVLGARCRSYPFVRADVCPRGSGGIALLPEVHHAEALLTGVAPRALHVLDGAGDDDALLEDLHGRSLRYVVRLPNAGPLVQTPDYLRVFAETRPHIILRSVTTSGDTSESRSRAARAPRDAVLALWAAPVELSSAGPVVGKTRSQVNLVTAIELHRSAVAAPIAWHLATSEPIQTAEQVVAVVDAYRSHRLIRDFFEALREGCRIEERSSSTAVDDALGIFLPIAFRLLALRHPPRNESCTVLSSRQVNVLACEISSRLPPRPTNEQVCRALAEFGGDARCEDPFSWTSLGMGLERLFVRELVWIAGATASLPAPNTAAQWLQ